MVFAVRSAESCKKKSTALCKSLICAYELPQAKSTCHTHQSDSYNQHNQACIYKYWVPHTPYFCHRVVCILLKGNEENKERNKENESGISAHCVSPNVVNHHRESIKSLPINAESMMDHKSIFKGIHTTKSL